MITCIGRFESTSPAKNLEMDGSLLTVIWLQDDFAMPISDAAMEAIKAIDWASHAFDFQY
jgi:hypothetical protein